ncbi:MAG: ABC transporter substrate-binding protein [Candidatus Acetothermia bacterium]|nr:ABC transporter substrate-binding protein [Candidatus Acetothermia bacterium]MDH7506015.1 ABC transporter substrate-binding protein [Candidatus Acetothermia bacterium]
MRLLRLVLLLVLGLAVTLGLQGAGPERLALMLDWLPNPNHVPLYVAQAEGLFAQEGLEVELLIPGNPADPAKLAAASRVDLAITTGLNLIVARAAGLPLVAIGALIQHPLGGLLALKGQIARLEDLRGKRIGYSLEPEEPVLWRAMLGCVGLGPRDYELINVGFNTVSALLSGAVEAIGAFRNYEKILVELQGEETVFFPMEDYCIPDHYELVFVASEGTLAARPGALAHFIAALAGAVELTLRDPNRAIDLFFQANPELEDELNLRSFLVTILYLVGSPCVNDPERWLPLVAFLFGQGLIAKEAGLEELITTRFLPPGCSS